MDDDKELARKFVQPDGPGERTATLREARDLLRYHALRASDAARGGSNDAALAHAGAAQALKDAILLGDLDASRG